MSEVNLVRLSKVLTLGAMAGVGVELTGADVEALVRNITGMGEEIKTLNARISELTKEIEKLQEKVKQMYKAGTAMYDQIDEVRKAEHQSLAGWDRYADRGWLFATSGMDDEDEWQALVAEWQVNQKGDSNV